MVRAFWLGYQGITTDQIRRVDGSGNVLSSVDSLLANVSKALRMTEGICGQRARAGRYRFHKLIRVPETSATPLLPMFLLRLRSQFRSRAFLTGRTRCGEWRGRALPPSQAAKQ